VIDARRRAGARTGQFLLLGSASGALLAQSAESLAGRVAYLELPALSLAEVGAAEASRLWVRGGFPEALLAGSDSASLRWRQQFISTYLERDIPQLGPAPAAQTLRRLWTMLAHEQGHTVQAARLRGFPVGQRADRGALPGRAGRRDARAPASALGSRTAASVSCACPRSSCATAASCMPCSAWARWTMCSPTPWPAAAGRAWVIENALAVAPPETQAFFYRSAAGAEIDLVLELPGGARWALEVKLSSAPKVSRGFHAACEDVEPTRRCVVHGGDGRFPLPSGVEALPVAGLMEDLAALGRSGTEQTRS
jgi:predicted AAA+ superfamily ATPase